MRGLPNHRCGKHALAPMTVCSLVVGFSSDRKDGASALPCDCSPPYRRAVEEPGAAQLRPLRRLPPGATRRPGGALHAHDGGAE